MDKYNSQQLRAFADQLKRGPKRLRLRQLLGIEFLLSIIEPDKSYPFDFVCHGLTGYRPVGGNGNGNSQRLFEGGALVTDLITLAEDLSENAALPLEDWSEHLSTVDELADRFDVSTKTIFRWRRRGLAGWRFRHPEDRRSRLLFAERCVRRFVAQNIDLVSRGSSFSQLTKRERAEVVKRATSLVEEGHRTVNAVARTIATETGRAVETIRLILKHHDEAHPGSGLFNRSPLDVEANDQRLAVWEAYVDGATIRQLAGRFEKPTGWIYKTIAQMRARDLRARKIEYVESPEFDAPEADEAILRTPPAAPLRQELSTSSRRVPGDLPPYLAQLFRTPLLTRAGEAHLFRKMNYLKYQASRLLEKIEPDEAQAQELDHVEHLLEQANRVKNEIVQANLRLVVSIAKRHLNGTHDLFELISDGNVSLMRAVEKFDYMRGFKFSTYASWAIMKNFARSIPEQHQHRERYQTGWEELLDSAGSVQPDEAESDQLAAVRGTVDRMLATLDDRECSILRRRFGLDDHGQPETLEQIGHRFGVSKERIRQLEARAMARLRDDFESDVERLLGN